MNQCNIVHTLRSGKQVDNQASTPPNPIQHNPTQVSTSSSFTLSNFDKSKKDNSTDPVDKPIVLFSNRLKNNKKNAHIDKILEMYN